MRQTKKQKQDEAARLAAAREANAAIVNAGQCPRCGAGIRRNLALTGWFQCEQYGTTGFRKDSSKPSCSWQCFV